MPKHHTSVLPLVLGLSLQGLFACDTNDYGEDDIFADRSPESPIELDATIQSRWEFVPLPQPPGGEARGVTPASSAPVNLPWTVETFSFSAVHDFIAVTSAPGGVFAPVPSDITLLPPELADGFLIATTFRDENNAVIGFGTEQEVLDLANEEGLTTYTITIPDRGTLMLRQREDISWLLGEVTDMFANQDYVRVYEPVYVQINTIPGTGWIIGGTGEFAGSAGIFREVGWLRELNLLTGQHDLGVTLQVLFFL